MVLHLSQLLIAGGPFARSLLSLPVGQASEYLVDDDVGFRQQSPETKVHASFSHGKGASQPSDGDPFPTSSQGHLRDWGGALARRHCRACCRDPHFCWGQHQGSLRDLHWLGWHWWDPLRDLCGVLGLSHGGGHWCMFRADRVWECLLHGGLRRGCLLRGMPMGSQDSVRGGTKQRGRYRVSRTRGCGGLRWGWPMWA